VREQMFEDEVLYCVGENLPVRIESICGNEKTAAYWIWDAGQNEPIIRARKV